MSAEGKVVYLLSGATDIYTGLSKIGTSGGLKDRLYGLRNMYGQGCEYLDTIPGGRRLEAAIQYWLQDRRVRNEWFNLGNSPVSVFRQAVDEVNTRYSEMINGVNEWGWPLGSPADIRDLIIKEKFSGVSPVPLEIEKMPYDDFVRRNMDYRTRHPVAQSKRTPR